MSKQFSHLHACLPFGQQITNFIRIIVKYFTACKINYLVHSGIQMEGIHKSANTVSLIKLQKNTHNDLLRTCIVYS